MGALAHGRDRQRPDRPGRRALSGDRRDRRDGAPRGRGGFATERGAGPRACRRAGGPHGGRARGRLDRAGTRMPRSARQPRRTGVFKLRARRGGRTCRRRPSIPPRRNTAKIFVDGVEVPLAELPLQRAARGIEVRNHEEEIRFDDGEVVHLYGNAIPLRDPSGAPRGSIGAFVDVTRLKQAEAALLEVTAARTSSCRSFRTSCATRWPRSSPPPRSCSCAGTAHHEPREVIARQGPQPPGAPGRRSARRPRLGCLAARLTR